jgi:murein DD-endopeptidase MepM/ murein hydrolase activator NlpD
VVNLTIGEMQDVSLNNGDNVTVKLIDVVEIHDELRDAVREAQVRVAINGEEATIISGNYCLPVQVGDVKIDCPVTKGYVKNCRIDDYGFDKDARIRIWPADSPYLAPGTFVYPVNQRWFADHTQMGNEPVYVDWGEHPSEKAIQYHPWTDFGGAEEMVEVFAAVAGTVIISGEEILPGYDDLPVEPRYDVIVIMDDNGWVYRYSHLFSMEPAIYPGAKIDLGQKIAILGKEGGSGGWAHLHFAVYYRESSGKWAVEDAYAYIWEAYVNQYNPPLIAVARPHLLAYTGQPVRLDGSKSQGFAGEIASYEWTLSDGSVASGPVWEREYDSPGTYSEILKVTDIHGHVDYDYTTVQIRDRNEPEKMPPTIHAAYHPSLDIKPGDPVTFKVRTFRSETGDEVWDFGDGSPRVTTRSVMEDYVESESKGFIEYGYDPLKGKYAETVHSFAEPGHYIVTVERSNEYGYQATAHLHVEVMRADN